MALLIEYLKSKIVKSNGLLEGFNLDNFNETKKLFIIGIPGSGKTTFTDEVSKRFKINVYHLDDLWDSKKDKHLLKSNVIGELDNDVLTHIKSFTVPTIFDGVIPLLLSDRSYFKDKPILIINTSRVKSIYRVSKRDYNHRLNLSDIRHILDNNQMFNNELNEFKKEMLGMSTRIITACCIILDKFGKVLLQDHVKAGKWTFPVGKAETGEEPITVLKREMLEELLITITDAKLLYSFTSYRTLDDGNKVEYLTHIYHDVKFVGTPINNEPDKCKELRWVTKEDVKALGKDNVMDYTWAYFFP